MLFDTMGALDVRKEIRILEFEGVFGGCVSFEERFKIWKRIRERDFGEMGSYIILVLM